MQTIDRLTFLVTRYSSTKSLAVAKKSTLLRLRQNLMIVSSVAPARSTQGRTVMFKSRLILSVNCTKSADKVKADISAV